MRAMSALVLGGLLLACSAPPDGVGASSRAIVAGAADSADPAIVELVAVQGNALAKCTATLVSPHVLLTAAHCIAETAGARYVIFVGPDDSQVAQKDLLPVSAAIFDPLYNDNPADGHDIAIVALAQPLAIPTVPINRAPLTAAALRAPARYVGYGLTDGVAQSGDGVKRQGTAPIAQIGRNLILIAANPHGTCNGDSGGPLLLDSGAGEAVIGVVSFGDDQACLTNSFFQRIDTQVAWVDQQIARFDPGFLPAADGGVTGDAGAEVARPEPPRDAAPPPPDLAPPVVVPPPDAATPQVTTGPTGGITTAPPATSPPKVTGGFGCVVGGRGGGGGVWLSVLGLLLVRRRRHAAARHRRE
jgi:secreted trypsin-like serine protease